MIISCLLDNIDSISAQFACSPDVSACVSLKLPVLTIIYGPGNPANVVIQ